MKKTLRLEIEQNIIALNADIVYQQNPGWCAATNRPLYLSLLRPRSYFSYDPNEKYPLVIMICGGGFQGVDHNVWIPEMVYFAKQGFSVACIGYSVEHDSHYPQPEIETKAAIRYLRAHADELHIDANKIAVMGESAGAYLAEFTGLTNGRKEFEKGDFLDQDSSVQAVVVWYPPIGIWAEDDVPDETNSKMNELPDVRTFITKDCPPFLIFHGTGDTVVPPRQGEALYEALQEKGIESDLYLLEGAEHGDQHFVQKEVKALMLDFLKKHLK